MQHVVSVQGQDILGEVLRNQKIRSAYFFSGLIK